MEPYYLIVLVICWQASRDRLFYVRRVLQGFSASVFVNEHLTLGLTGLVPFYLCCFSAIAIVNNYVDTRGPKMEHVRMWLAILVCTGGVVCGLGVYYWFRWVREQQADRVQTRTKDPEAAPSTNPTELLPYSVSHGTLGEPAPADPNVSPKVSQRNFTWETLSIQIVIANQVSYFDFSSSSF
jgi:hypothetical protein